MNLRELTDSFLSVGYSFVKPRFLLFHLIFIIALTIIGSIMLYPGGHIAYIDALFMATGAATQAGLNTVNLNDMTVWQQVVLYIVPVFTNPISINTFLVFLRLYWFEKEFKDIAQKSWLDHRLRKAKSSGRDGLGLDLESNGVRGKQITILHSAKMTEANFPGYRRHTSPTHHARTASDQSAIPELDLQRGRRPSQSSDSDSCRSTRDQSPHHSLENHHPPPPKLGYASRDIRFGDLPSPRNHERQNSYSYLETGPALVVKSPREQELEAELAEQEAKRRGSPEIHFASPIAGARYSLPLIRRKSTTTTRSSDDDYGLEPDHDHDHDHDENENENEDEDEDEEITDTTLRPTRSNVVGPSNSNIDHYGSKITKRAITIEAPGRPQTNRHNTIGELFFHRTATMERLERIVSRTLRTKRDGSPNSRRSAVSRKSLAIMPYLSYEPTIARNSTFVGLTDAQREELGGVEYRALRTLAVVLIVYFLGFWILGTISLIPWIMRSGQYRPIVESYAQQPSWWAAFNAVSAFMDVGLTTVPTSMSQFQLAVFPLLMMGFLVVIGNTGFPVMLRFIIWLLAKLFPDGSATRESLLFLLDHPRRCFTLLFPSMATWWLFAVLVILNCLDLILFIVVDVGNPILQSWTAGQKILDGLFQAISTRTAGFAIVDISQLHPAVQVSYLVMMYISVLPIAISVRRTNVYEEQSLGIYETYDDFDDDDEEEDDEIEDEYSDRASDMGLANNNNDVPGAAGNGQARHLSTANAQDVEKQRRPSAVSTRSRPRFKRKRKKKRTQALLANHLRRQLSFDLWYIFLGLFIVCIAEGGKIQDPNNPAFTIFSVLFEIVSAYGTVGLSLGYPNTDTSFSAQFTVLSKLVIIAMMVSRFLGSFL
ncbi:cation transport protein-domain-containing protein [Lipomyces kononenkoae]|uniref:Cation transport protein-domain-containing protein n=1 Tax=Lipomyces kononenkoae TaxID=34357 RepID=A0ACC3SXP1_LIPKO